MLWSWFSPPTTVWVPGVEFGCQACRVSVCIQGAVPWCTVSNEFGSPWLQAGFPFFCMTSRTQKIVRRLLICPYHLAFESVLSEASRNFP